MFYNYYIRFVKYPNKNFIHVNGAYIPRIPKKLINWIDKKIFKKPYSIIWKKITGEFRDIITKSELYSKYKYNYTPQKVIKRNKIIDELLK